MWYVFLATLCIIGAQFFSVYPKNHGFLQPLPEAPPESDSILKVQEHKDMQSLFRKRHPFFVRKGLQELTFTTKHLWFPR